MTVSVWQGLAAQEVSGAINVLASPTVTVTDRSDGSQPNLFSDRAGNTALGNPFTADADGSIEFYVAPGRYRIEAASGGNTVTWDNVMIGVMDLDAFDDSAASAGTIDGTESVPILQDDTTKKATQEQLRSIPRTQAEIDAGVTPSDTKYEVGNVLRYGAAADGTTDDTTAINNAMASSRFVYFPPGRYRVTSTITITKKTLFWAEVNPGTPTDQDDLVTIVHDFNGTLFDFVGVDGDVNASVGGGLENLVLQQAFGDGTTHAGKAIRVVHTDATQKMSWLMFRNLRIRYDVNGGADDWEYAFYFDGTGDPADGVRDCFIENCWTNIGSNGTGALYGEYVVNLKVLNSFFQGTNGVVEITGDSTPLRSSIVFLQGVQGTHLKYGWAQNCIAKGCSFTDLTTTSNTRESELNVRLTNAPTLAGTRVYFDGSINGTAYQYRATNPGSAPQDFVDGFAIGQGTLAQKMLAGAESLSFGTVSANGTSTQTMTVTGAVATDVVFVSPLSGSPGSGLIWSARVSAADTVEIRLVNPSTGSVASTDRTWKSVVWRTA